MRLRDVVAPAALIVVGAAALLEARTLDIGTLGRPGPGFFPFTLATGLVIAAAALLVQGMLRPTESGPADRLVHGRAALTLLVTTGYVFGLERLGFGVATALYLLFLFRVIEPRRWIVSVALAVGSTAAALVVFKLVLAVRLPAGPWGF